MASTVGMRAMVGRDAELATARRVLAASRAGDGGVLLVTGEAGIGKSRLLAELAALAGADGYAVLSLIGADGPRSGVRTGLGIEVDDLGMIGGYVAVTFRADLTRRLPGTPAVINAVEVAGASWLFVPTSTDDRWIYAREWHPDSGESIADWTTERCTELIRAGSGLPTCGPRSPR